jgi:hypothetical protein
VFQSSSCGFGSIFLKYVAELDERQTMEYRAMPFQLQVAPLESNTPAGQIAT